MTKNKISGIKSQIYLNKMFLFKMSDQEETDYDGMDEEDRAEWDAVKKTLNREDPKETPAQNPHENTKNDTQTSDESNNEQKKLTIKIPVDMERQIKEVYLTSDSRSKEQVDEYECPRVKNGKIDDEEKYIISEEVGDQDGYMKRWLFCDRDKLIQREYTLHRKVYSDKLIAADDPVRGGLLCFESFNTEEFLREVGIGVKDDLVKDIREVKYYRREQDMWVLISEQEATRIFSSIVMKFMERALMKSQTVVGKKFIKSRMKEWKNPDYTNQTLIMQLMFDQMKLPITEMIKKGHFPIKVEEKKSEAINSTVGKFIEECVKLTNNENDAFLSTELHKIFSKWSKQNFHEEIGLTSFGRSLSQAKLKSKKSRKGTKYYGIKILGEFVGCNQKNFEK